MKISHNTLYTNKQPLTARFPFIYRHMPDKLRFAIGRTLGEYQATREHKWGKLPEWPLDFSGDKAKRSKTGS